MAFEDDLDRYFRQRPTAPAGPIRATRLLMRTAVLLEARMDRALAPHGLLMREYLALAFISLHKGERLRPSELSTSLDASRTQVTRLLDALESQGLVERQAAVEDRRALQLALTPAGSRKLSAAAPGVHEAYRQSWSTVGDDFEATLRGLRAVNAQLEADGEGAAP